jgi:hypothetical protein
VIERALSPKQVFSLLVLALVASAPGLVGAGGGKPVNHKDDAIKLLRYSLEAEKRAYRLGEPIQVKATLINVGSNKVAVFERSLLRYCNYERLPITEDGFSTEGQVIGDTPPGDGPPPATVLNPKDSLSKEFDIVRLIKPLGQKPGKYRISLDYCHEGNQVIEGVRAPLGCVRSNELLLEVKPADES